ncbi:MAG: acetylornithine deacetylase [Enterobacteriaceae bacterium]
MAFPAMSDQVRSILAKLLAFDTTSHLSNLELIHTIQDYLTTFGIASQLFYDDGKNKANLYARIGPAGDGGVMLSGHTDVVPVTGQAWSVPPFELTQQQDRYYGRGSADMKGFLACVLASVPQFMAQPLRIPLHLAFSYDEEVGCLGVRSLVEHLNACREKPAMCIVGEPTSMQPVYGHKGKLAMRCTVHGHPCHSAYAPEGVNAIEYAARLIHYLNTQQHRLGATQDNRFTPPYSTLQVGTIQGGTALNIVPQTCQFDFEIRHLPQLSPEAVIDDLRQFAEHELLPAMQAISANSAITFQPLSQYSGLLTEVQSDFAAWLLQWSGGHTWSTVAFGTEGGLFDQAGIATLICGPGSIEQAHKPDEYVAIAQLDSCMSMLDNLRQWMAL